MPNSKVTVRAQVSYVDAYGQNQSLPATVLEPEYTAQVHGSLDIPDATAAGDFVIPFGSVDKATAVMLKNSTGQAIDISVNAGDVTYTALPDGKAVLLALPCTPGLAPITAVTVTTGATQDGAGTVAYDIWGDPV